MKDPGLLALIDKALGYEEDKLYDVEAAFVEAVKRIAARVFEERMAERKRDPFPHDSIGAEARVLEALSDTQDPQTTLSIVRAYGDRRAAEAAKEARRSLYDEIYRNWNDLDKEDFDSWIENLEP